LESSPFTVGTYLRNMDTQDKCDELIENYGYIPQAIPRLAWLTVFPPGKARYFHTYYGKVGAPELVKDGRELAWHPMLYATRFLEKQEQAERDKEELEKIIQFMFPNEPHDQP